MNQSPQFWLKNAHINTIFTSQYRKVKEQPYSRKRIPTHDNDFLDVTVIPSSSMSLNREVMLLW